MSEPILVAKIRETRFNTRKLTSMMTMQKHAFKGIFWLIIMHYATL